MQLAKKRQKLVNYVLLIPVDVILTLSFMESNYRLLILREREVKVPLSDPTTYVSSAKYM
jgi:hypothetical protein